MGWFDNVIAAVSPRRAYEREMWRQGLEELRGYDAAGNGRINSGWRVTNESAEATDKYSRDIVRARARDLERNSDIAQAVLHAYKRNVVGKGYTLRATTGNDELDKRIEKAWKRWCKARNCDVTGEQSFNEILRMMVERKKVDGGMIVLYRHTRGGVVPFKLQCLEVDELDKTQATPHQQGNRVVGGIEYNQYRRPVGYWIRQYDIEGWQLAEPAFIEASDDDAEKIFGKVKTGTLKTTSVRYSVDAWEEVKAGAVSADGRFTGPCHIARKWTALEMSIVSVPADATVGVGRSDNGPPDLSLYERQIQINKNKYWR